MNIPYAAYEYRPNCNSLEWSRLTITPRHRDRSDALRLAANVIDIYLERHFFFARYDMADSKGHLVSILQLVLCDAIGGNVGYGKGNLDR